MLRNLLDEIMHRRLWPVVLGAVVVAVAAPLLFMKSAPSADVSSAAPAAAPAGELPARAQRLLTADGAPAGTARKLGAKATDPFRAPASQRRAPAAASAGKRAASAKAATGPAVDEPVPVVITNSDGTKPATSSPSTPTTTPSPPVTTRAPAKTVARRSAAVAVRFGERLPGRVHRAIARRQTFVAGGRVIAIFVKYSPNRDKAVFAIAPSTHVSGDVACRRKEDLCRYVDVPVGEHVRLTTLTAGRKLVSRRLDVMRIDRSPSAGGSAATSRTAPADGACLLGRLLALGAKDSPLAADACKS